MPFLRSPVSHESKLQAFYQVHNRLVMGEQAYSSLPVILVSAKDHGAASHIIAEIIDNDVTETYKAKEGDVVQDHVWRIVNKYYTADVRLCASGDEQLPGGDEPVDAHIIYLQEDECAVSWLSRRAVRGGHVRLVLNARGGDALAARAARLGYELVPLARDTGADGHHDDHDHDHDDDDDDDCGVSRARAALHAHAWRGLLRHAATRHAPLAAHTPESESECESPGSDAEECVERAELFAAALGALPGAARDTRAAAAGAPRELRLARAEALLHEFCRALGLPPDDC